MSAPAKGLQTYWRKPDTTSFLLEEWKLAASDDEVLRKAEEEDRILITDDKDFGELVFRLGKPSKGVLLLRMSTTDPAKRFQLLMKVLRTVDVREKFVVVRDDIVRIRKLL